MLNLEKELVVHANGISFFLNRLITSVTNLLVTNSQRLIEERGLIQVVWHE